MADVFVSYARSDKARVAPVVACCDCSNPRGACATGDASPRPVFLQRRHAERALTHTPDFVEALNTLGNIRLLAGDIALEVGPDVRAALDAYQQVKRGRPRIEHIETIDPADIERRVLAFAEAGEGVIVQPPVYFPFFSSVTTPGRRLIENPLREENGRSHPQLTNHLSGETQGAKPACGAAHPRTANLGLPLALASP